jgi:hypothetical protein
MSEKKYQDWICPRCGQEVSSIEKPEPIKWTDGHQCSFILVRDEEHRQMILELTKSFGS